MSKFFLLILFSVFSLSAYSQPLDDGGDKQRTVYFLIDASGSMKGHLGEVEKKLDAKIILLDNGWMKSVTYFGFRSKSKDVPVRCEDEVELSGATDQSLDVPPFPKLGGIQDKTSIGKALDSVLEIADREDRVVLITDGVDECSSGFLKIRSRYPKVEIEVIPVGNNPNTALNLLELAPINPFPNSEINYPFPVSVSFEEKGSDWEEADFFTKWFWFFGVIIMVAAVIWFGLQQGSKARIWDTRLKSLRDQKRTIQDGKLDIGAAEKMLIEVQSEIGKSGKFWIPMVFFLFGFFWLGVLAFFPSHSSDLMKESRRLAWIVVGSPFATVLAVLTSTPLFFASSQYWRGIQLKQTFDSEIDRTKISGSVAIFE